MKEVNLDVIMDQMRTASSEGKLNQYLEQALSSLDDLQARYEFCSEEGKQGWVLGALLRSCPCCGVQGWQTPWLLLPLGR